MSQATSETAGLPQVWGGLLIGGGSRRMGSPKQMLEVGGVTLAERAAAALAPHVAGLAVLGAGELPAALAGLDRIADVELGGNAAETGGGARPAGPLAGMLAAMRRRPGVAWVFAPCDLPAVEPAAVEWLLGQRRPDRRAVLPRAGDGAPPEPLLALYEPAARELLEALAAAPAASRAPHRIAQEGRVATPVIPAELAGCWVGVNTPAELAALGRGQHAGGAGRARPSRPGPAAADRAGRRLNPRGAAGVQSAGSPLER